MSDFYQRTPDEQGLAEVTVAERQGDARLSAPGRWVAAAVRTLVVALIFFMAGLGILWLLEKI